MLRKHETHNTNPEVKLRLRREAAERVDHGLAFDLFCGEGTYLREVYAPTFAQTVAVDRSAKSLSKIAPASNLHLFKGDNAILAPKLAVRYGLPDLIDLDAFGNSDAPLVALRSALQRKERFAIIGTDGTHSARKAACAVPECWGLRDPLWSRGSLSLEEWPVLIYRHIAYWFPAHAITWFEWAIPRGHSVVYYAAALKKTQISEQNTCWHR